MYPRSPVERNMALGKNSQFSGAGLKEAQDGAGKAGRGKTKSETINKMAIRTHIQ